MRRLLALLGGDVSASLSPRLHRAAADACELDVAYVPVSCANDEAFRRAVDALRVLGAIGCNVTIPFKRAALEACSRLSTTAQEIGAVNTLTFGDDDRLQGDNTDGPGLRRVLEALPAGALERVQILGAGGGARAAAWAVSHLSPREVHVTARRGAEALAGPMGAEAHPLERVAGATLIISALPGDRALAREALAEWVDARRNPIVCDLAYGTLDRDSALVLSARAAGLSAFDGRAMLAEQAALSLSLWTGGEVSRIRAAMRRTLGLREEGVPGFGAPFG